MSISDYSILFPTISPSLSLSYKHNDKLIQRIKCETNAKKENIAYTYINTHTLSLSHTIQSILIKNGLRYPY